MLRNKARFIAILISYLKPVYIKGICLYRCNLIAEVNCTGSLFVCLFVTGLFGTKMLRDYNCTIFQMSVILVLMFPSFL